MSTGASSIRSARCSIRSSSGSSAQWTSSKPSTSGCASAKLVAHSCAAQAISRPRRLPETLSSTPDASPSRSATASLVHASRSFSIASSGESSSEIPAAACTISASGRYAMPSPNGAHRPVRTLVRSSPAKNSCASRLLPIPGSPKIVTSCARRSRTTRAKTLPSRSSSSSRPTYGAATLIGRPVGRSAQTTRRTSIEPFSPFNARSPSGSTVTLPAASP